MERKVLKWMTICLGVITMVFCIGFYFAPIVKDSIETLASNTPEKNTEKNTEKSTGQEIVTEKEPTESEIVLVDGDLDITLPNGVKEKDVEIVNDYANNIIYVYFAKTDDNYSENQVAKGDCDYITDLSYSKGEGEEGVLQITLNKPCEHAYSFEDGHLRMDFTDVHELYDKIVVIDAGHGGSEPGAIRKGINEKKLNLEIVLKIKELFDEVDEKEIKVFYTRTEDKHVSLQDRVKLANNLQADLFISIHNNSQGEEEFNEINGTMVLFSEGGLKESERLARKCLSYVTKNTGSKNQGLIQGDYVYIVRTSEVPVSLIEVGFMTNEQELDNLASAAYQRKVAQGVYDAIMEALTEGL